MSWRPQISETSNLQILTAILAAITGFIHFYLAPQIGLNTLGISFAFAGLGFTVLIISIIYNYRLKLAYLLAIPFTVGQILIWYYMNRPSLEFLIRGEPVLDALDKLAQMLLIFLLSYLYFSEGDIESER